MGIRIKGLLLLRELVVGRSGNGLG